MNEELLIDREQMFRLVQVDKVLYVLAVICGGAAMYERRVLLNADEIHRWKEEGKVFLTTLAKDIAKNEDHYSDRFFSKSV